MCTLEPLLWFSLHKAPYWHHKTAEGLLLVTKGAKPPWARRLPQLRTKAMQTYQLGELFLLPSSWLAGQDSCCVCASRCSPWHSPGKPSFGFTPSLTRKNFSPSKPLPGRWILISPTSGVEFGKPSSELLKKLLQGILTANPKIWKGCCFLGKWSSRGPLKSVCVCNPSNGCPL